MISVSVVIPLYNKALHIGRALDSVSAQTRQPQEILVIDDGSTDGGGSIVTSYNNRRVKLVRQKNQGVSAARNRGIGEAQGDIIAFLDADDQWEPGFLEVIDHLVEKYPRAGAYATAYQIIAPQGRAVPVAFPTFPAPIQEGLIDNYYRECIRCRVSPICSSGVAVPKKVLQEIGGFPVGVNLSEDLDTWLRIALRHPIAWSSKIEATYFQDAVNRVAGVKRYAGEPRVSQTAREALESGLVPPDLVPDLRDYMAIFQILAAKDCLLQGRKDLTRRLLDYSRGCSRLRPRCKWWLLRLLLALPGPLGPGLMTMIDTLMRRAKARMQN